MSTVEVGGLLNKVKRQINVNSVPEPESFHNLRSQ